ncbi:unnamed protein product [Adineta steineri]|uniref:UV-damage endonuclease n=1 Tax=Adineta steineri TaxID=433720 RepID=A0A814TBJ1_9BILA|nr:unnamed protein product [Adineta steineri]CAF1159241.1 unnamed protein product [Adineta steineri]
MEVRRRSQRMAKVLVEAVTKKSPIKIEKQEPCEEKLSILKHAAQLLRSTGMKIGYPCLNTSLCTPSHIFRLANYTDEKCLEVTKQNLTCLQKILEYNIQHGFYFFRISSQTVPFASHSICTTDWIKHFSLTLRNMGQYIKDNDCRISMHPDQFCLINAKDENIINRSIAELDYHCRLLDEMDLDSTAKIQIHVGGLYGDKQASMDRFIDKYKTKLNDAIRRRLVIENDDRLFSVQDCLYIHEHTQIPILFDNLHHACLNNGETMMEAMKQCFATWPNGHRPMIDYATQQTGKRVGAHADHIDEKHFELFTKETRDLQFDIMLEIKDKEQSAIIAVPYAARERVQDQSLDIEPANYRYIYENAQRLQMEVNERKRAREEKKKSRKAINEDDEGCKPKPAKKQKLKKN